MTNEWVKHGDKVCIDSGSDAWRGMVAAGAIAGEGAAPVERLENLDVLRKVKKLWGRWTTTSCRRTAASSSFPEPIDDFRKRNSPNTSA